MWHYVITFLVALILTVGIIVGKAQSKNSEGEYSKIYYAESIADGKLNREEIKTLLTQLPASTDRELQMGAMCYEMVSITTAEKVEYHCPKCWAITSYKTDSPIFFQVSEEIVKCRRLEKQIKGIKAKLDARQFCKKCGGGVESPKLALNVTLPGEKTVHRVEGISAEDLTLLIEFTGGKTTHENEREEVSLLKDKQKRLEELLGVSVLEK